MLKAASYLEDHARHGEAELLFLVVRCASQVVFRIRVLFALSEWHFFWLQGTRWGLHVPRLAQPKLMVQVPPPPFYQ